MEDKYIVSFCLPVYHSESTLLACLESVKKCGFENKDYEIIVVNDGDGDKECDKIIKEFRESNIDIKVKYIKHIKNMGLLEARRSAILQAEGKFISIVDSDDLIIESGFKKLYDKAMTTNTDYDVIQGNFDVLCDNITSDSIVRPLTTVYHDEISLLRYYLLTRSISGFLWAKFIKRSVYLQVLDAIPERYITFTEDFLMSFFICKFSHDYFCDSDIYVYEYNRKNNSCTTFSDTKSINLKRINGLLSCRATMDIINPNRFGDPILKEKVIETYIIFLKEIYRGITLIEDIAEKTNCFKSFVNHFGKPIYEELTKQFKECQEYHATHNI